MKNPLNLSIGYFFVTGAAFVISCLAGYFLLRIKNIGFILSIIVQGVQIFQLIWNGSRYKFEAGLQVLITISGRNFTISPGFNVGLWFGHFPLNSPSAITINFIALLAFLYLIMRAKPVAKAIQTLPEKIKSESAQQPASQGLGPKSGPHL
jgi:hypothetical protein